MIMEKAFLLVANSLEWAAKKIGLTYNELNIIVYYLILPLTWTVMTDILIGWPVVTPLLALSWGLIFFLKRKDFPAWCDDTFRRSVDFLLWFRRIGWSYTVSSVIICVVLPLLVYGWLFAGLAIKFQTQ